MPSRDGWRSQPRPKNWKRLRERVLKRDGYVCRIGYPSICTVTATDVDHVLAASRGGTDSLDNLQSACGGCHRRKTGLESGFGARPSRRRAPEPHPGEVRP